MFVENRESMAICNRFLDTRVFVPNSKEMVFPSGFLIKDVCIVLSIIIPREIILSIFFNIIRNVKYFRNLIFLSHDFFKS